MEEIPLWEGFVSGSESFADDEIRSRSLPGGYEMVRNISTPTLTPFLPDEDTDKAIIVCPGGAFHFVAIEHEGTALADVIRLSGVAAFVLKYRVVNTPHEPDRYEQAIIDAFAAGIHEVAKDVVPLAVADAHRALAILRSRGYRHVTMIGFSAGARIVNELVLQADSEDRPDAAAMIYLPWVNRRDDLVELPPLFIVAAADDPLGVTGSFDLAEMWRKDDAPFEFHFFSQGGHGFGAGLTGHSVDVWPDLFLAWHRSVSA